MVWVSRHFDTQKAAISGYGIMQWTRTASYHGYTKEYTKEQTR